MSDTRKKPAKFTPARQTTFLDALRDGETVVDAALKAGVNRDAFYRRRKADTEFASAWDDAYERGTDKLEREAQRRAVEGVPDFKVGPGGQLVEMTRYSDTLLIFLLKARRPWKFRDNVRVEHSGPAGGPIMTEHKQGLTLEAALELVAQRRQAAGIKTPPTLQLPSAPSSTGSP